MDSRANIYLLNTVGLGRYMQNISSNPLDAFFESSAVSLTATAVTPSESAENWGSILRGVLPRKHQLTNKAVEAGGQYNEDSQYPSIFKILSQSVNIQLASFASWLPINTGIIEKSVKGDFYSPLSHEGFWNKLRLRLAHWFGYSFYDAILVPKLVEYIRDFDDNHEDQKLLLFIHLTDVDEYGHAHNYGSEKYYNQIRTMGSHVETILNAIDDAGWKDDTLVIMTTDHGGIGNRHGGQSDEEVGVFIAVSGPGIKKGEIGAARNMDCAALVLHAFGFEIPIHFDAKIQPFLSCFNHVENTIDS